MQPLFFSIEQRDIYDNAVSFWVLPLNVLCVINCYVVFQAERADPLTVGISHEWKAELLESILQPGVLWKAPCAGAFHSALPFQVRTSRNTSLLLLLNQNLTLELTHDTCYSTRPLMVRFFFLKVLEEHVPPVWPVYAPTAVHPQNGPNSEREQPQGRGHIASTGEREFIHANDLKSLFGNS